jgi:hypothetical protein
MRTFLVPAQQGETFQDYADRVSGLDWVFTASRSLDIATIGEVSLDGDKPVDSDFEEKIVPEPKPTE